MIKNIIKVFIALFLIIFILWNRLFRMRLPKDVFALDVDVIHFILTIFLIFIFLLLLINAIFELLGLTNEIKVAKKGYLNKIFTVLEEYVFNSPKYLLNLISLKIDLKIFIEKPLSYLVAYFYYPKIINFTLYIVPTMLLSTIFFVDLVCFFRITYFYKILVLLLIPIIFKIILFIVDDFCNSYIFYLNHHIYFEKDDNTKLVIVKPVVVTPMIPNALNTFEIQKHFNWLCAQWEIYTTIKNFCNKVYEAHNNIKYYVQVYNYTLYFLGWNYYLYFVLVS